MKVGLTILGFSLVLACSYPVLDSKHQIKYSKELKTGKSEAGQKGIFVNHAFQIIREFGMPKREGYSLEEFSANGSDLLDVGVPLIKTLHSE